MSGEVDIKHSVLQSAGLSLSSKGLELIEETSPRVFQNKLEELICISENASSVVAEVQEYIEDAAQLRHSLMPLNSSENPSLLRILLNIRATQPAIVNILLERLPVFSLDDSTTSISDASSIPRLILFQLRWMDMIVDPEELSRKMLEMVSCTPLDIQREIIGSLPEVLDDRAAEAVVDELTGLMEDHSELTVSVLDTLANLSLPENAVDEIRDYVLERLGGYDVDAMPVIIRFVLQSSSPKVIVATIKALRKNLEFESLVTLSESQESNDMSTQIQKSFSRMGELGTLDALQSGLKFQKTVADAWLQVISRISKEAEHKAIDLFILLILCEVNGSKKAAYSLFSRKTKATEITPDLIDKVFQQHSRALRSFSRPLLALAEGLMRGKSQVLRKMAAKLYSCSFDRFDNYAQQEVVGGLVTHVGSGDPLETTAALKVLHDLTQTRPERVWPFQIFLKGLLDYIDNLTMENIRILFRILCTLGVTGDGRTSDFDELYIFIRKMLSKMTLHEKRVGIVGATTMVRAHVEARDRDIPKLFDDSSSMNQGVGEIVPLLKMVKALIIGKSEEDLKVATVPRLLAAGLFFDELAATVTIVQFSGTELEWINDNICCYFQELFLRMASEEVVYTHREVHLALGLCLEDDDITSEGNDEDDDSVVISALPLMIEQGSPRVPGSPELVMCMCPLFKVLQAVERSRSNNRLDEIDALVGCGIWGVQNFCIEQFSGLSFDGMDFVCNSLFVNINWCREVINAYTEQDTEMKIKVIQRLDDLVRLEAHLAQCLTIHSAFVPMPAQFEEDCEVRLITKKEISKVTDRKNGIEYKIDSTKAKKRAKNVEESISGAKWHEDCDETDEVDDGNEGHKNDESVSSGKRRRKQMSVSKYDDDCDEQKELALDYKKLQPYFREFELRVFEVISYNIISDKLDTQSSVGPSSRKTFSVSIPALTMLLRDLAQKLKRSLHPPKSTPWRDGISSIAGFSLLLRNDDITVTKWAASLFGRLCAQLELMMEFFGEIIADHDGMNDTSLFSKDPTCIERAVVYELLLSNLCLVISWTGFRSTKNHKLLCEILTCFAERIVPDSQSTFSELCSQAFRYISRFSESIPSIDVFVALIEVLTAIREISDSENHPEMSKVISMLCGKSLTKSWSLDVKKPIKIPALKRILEIYLSSNNDALVVVEELICTGAAELVAVADHKGAIVSETFKTMVKGTFPCYFKAMSDTLIAILTGCLEIDGVNLKIVNTKTPEFLSLVEMQLSRIDSCIEVWKSLVKVTEHESLGTKVIFATLFKSSKAFVETFIKNCIPLYQLCFAEFRQNIVNTIKGMQKTTRYLQRVCSHYKDDLKDATLSAHIPGLKRSLETLLYRTRDVLSANGAEAGLTIGCLKTKDFRGNDVSSQVELYPESQQSHASDDDLDTIEHSGGLMLDKVKEGEVNRDTQDFAENVDSAAIQNDSMEPEQAALDSDDTDNPSDHA